MDVSGEQEQCVYVEGWVVNRKDLSMLGVINEDAIEEWRDDIYNRVTSQRRLQG